MVYDFSLPQDQLISLYSSGKSMLDISKYFNCSVHKVVYWMNKYHIKRRSISEAIYLLENPNGDPFKIKRNLSLAEQKLYGIGLGIYWGEGEKVSKHNVKVVNSDPHLILTFRTFLLSICQIIPSKIHYYLICFNDSDPQEVGEYWGKILNTSVKKFGKIVQIPPQGKGTYKKKSRYGVCSIQVSNLKLKAWVMHEIESLNQADIV